MSDFLLKSNPTMNPTPSQPERPEHNPDGLTPEQYGAPEWRLLKLREKSQAGDEWWDNGRWAKANWLGLIPVKFDTYRRRVATSPTQPR